MANLLLLVSCLAPCTLPGLLFLRSCLLLGFSCSFAWACTISCSLDSLLWSFLLTTTNLCWVVGLVWRLRPVTLEADMEEVYTKLFLPLKVESRSTSYFYSFSAR